MSGPPITKRFVIFCDESAEEGEYYSHFYGGALVDWTDRQAIEAELQAKKDELNIFGGELKWTKISEPYAQKYCDFLDLYFDMVKAGRIKIRLMFSQNINVKPTFDDERTDNEYFLLYYQFVKHAFGLRYWNYDAGRWGNCKVAVYLDDPPQNAAKFDRFKSYMCTLSDFPFFSAAGVIIEKEDITGVNSRHHNILQGVDIILGGMHSKLNEVHTRVKPPARRLSKKAKAKSLVYAKIKERIWDIYPRFNIGGNTGTVADDDRWNHPYRHWKFVPTGSVMDPSKGKKR